MPVFVRRKSMPTLPRVEGPEERNAFRTTRRFYLEEFHNEWGEFVQMKPFVYFTAISQYVADV